MLVLLRRISMLKISGFVLLSVRSVHVVHSNVWASYDHWWAVLYVWTLTTYLLLRDRMRAHACVCVLMWKRQVYFVVVLTFFFRTQSGQSTLRTPTDKLFVVFFSFYFYFFFLFLFFVHLFVERICWCDVNLKWIWSENCPRQFRFLRVFLLSKSINTHFLDNNCKIQKKPLLQNKLKYCSRIRNFQMQNQ